MSGNGRLIELDRAKGLAIFLVVLGHLVTGDPPQGNDWFGGVVKVIYSFHMPFFMYLSGLVMYHTFRGVETFGDYLDYVARKFNRLAPGFFLFAVIILCGKMAASHLIHVDNMPSGFLPGILDILVTPGLSAAKSLWFIYVLFEFYVLAPILLIMFKRRVLPIVAVALVIHHLPATPVLMIDGVFEYLIYFAVGMFVAQHYPLITTLLRTYSHILVSVFLASLVLVFVDISQAIAKLLIGLLSIPAIHSMMYSKPFASSEILLSWGSLSYAIYLMNTIAIGLAKGVVLAFASWDGHNFLWVAPVLLVCGLVGPILIKRLVFQRVSWLDRITN